MNKCDKASEVRNYGMGSIAGGTTAQFGVADAAIGSTLMAEARMAANCGSESLRSRAERKARLEASEAFRFEQLASKLTPEIETAIWCFGEAIRLGLIDGGFLLEAEKRRQVRMVEAERNW